MTNLRFSRFTHLLDIENVVAIYNSLNLAVTYVNPQTLLLLKEYITDNGLSDETPESVTDLMNRLVQQNILVKNDENEISKYAYWKDVLPTLPVGVLYLLLTDSCNFFCTYCVIEGGMPNQLKRSLMSIDTAQKAIDLFAQTIKTNKKSDEHALIASEPQIILYGGEPLINQVTLQFVLDYTRELKKNRQLPESLGITMNTNASLVTQKIADMLADHQVTVAVSIDGKQAQHDAARKYKSGQGTFNDVLWGYMVLKESDVNVSVSCTLGWHNLNDAQDILQWFVNELGVSGFGFNILVDSETIRTQNLEEYADKVSDTLIQCFITCRDLGVYEDRMMRKTRAFVEGQLHINDCAGCGQQIVITPDGQAGTCQAYAGSRKFFVNLSEQLDVKNHPIWQEWRMRSPLNMPQCVDCIALGICGGGCPHNADQRTGSIWNTDEVFCVHAKKTTRFLIDDLFKNIYGAKEKTQMNHF